MQSFKPKKNHQPLLDLSIKYFIAVFCVMSALFVSWLLAPFIGAQSHYLIGYSVVLLIALFHGIGPGLLAGNLGSMVLESFGDTLFSSFSFDPVWLSRFVMANLAVILSGFFGKRMREARAASEAMAAHAKQSEERLRILTEASFDGVVTSQNGIIIDCNQPFADMVGYSAQELVGKDIDSLLPEDARNQQAVKISKNLDDYSQHELLHKSGKSICVEMRRYSVMLATNELTVTSFRNITGYLKIAKDLIASNERLDIAQQAGKVGVYDWDIKTGKAFWTPQLKLMFDFVTIDHHANYQLWAQHMYPEDARQFWKELNHWIATLNQDAEFDYRYILPNGKTNWFRARFLISYDVDGQPTRMIGTNLNITSQKNHELELERAKEAAEEANQGKSYFLANMSHEIRTPLSAILGFGELLLENHLSPEERHKFLGIIVKNGYQLQTLIDDLLDLSKLDIVKMNIQNVPISIAAILQDFKESFKPKFDEKNITFSVFDAPSMPSLVMSDPDRIRQILANLLGNACKFTVAGGNVSLKTRYNQQQETCTFIVEDNGTGIPESEWEKIFQPFHQAHNAQVPSLKGVGLGLTLSRTLAQLLGGSLGLMKSQPGQGSVFHVTIPAPQCEKSSHFSSAAGPTDLVRTAELSGMRILLAEDTEDTQIYIARLLANYGIDLTLAGDGEKAVELALKEDFDLILMDMRMPKMDGLTATARLRQQGYSKPIIALTAQVYQQDIFEAIRAGCNGHLGKPIINHLLLAEIKKIWNEPACLGRPEEGQEIKQISR